jgi:hypothetical protein
MAQKLPIGRLGLLLLLLLCFTSIMAQNDSIVMRKYYDRRNFMPSTILKVGAFSNGYPDDHPFMVFAEHAIAKKRSIQVGFLPRPYTFKGKNVLGLCGMVGFRNYLGKRRKGLTGFYIMPFAKYGTWGRDEIVSNAVISNPVTNQLEVIDYEISDLFKIFTAGIGFGYQWIIKDQWQIEIGSGATYLNSNGVLYTTKFGVTSKEIWLEKNFYPMMSISVGYTLRSKHLQDFKKNKQKTRTVIDFTQ